MGPVPGLGAKCFRVQGLGFRFRDVSGLRAAYICKIYGLTGLRQKWSFAGVLKMVEASAEVLLPLQHGQTIMVTIVLRTCSTGTGTPMTALLHDKSG